MGLNDIQLNAHQLEGLYSNTLVEPTIFENARQAPESIFGNNEKKIVLLVSSKDNAFLQADELQFLVSILSACKLSLDDVAIVNLAGKTPSSVPPIVEKLAASSVILFGIPSSAIGLPMNFPQFQLQQFDKRIYLQSPSLQELMRDKPLKTLLWKSLKTMFQL